MQVNNVVIVGGGSSGWMTAAALLKLCPWISVVLVESKKHKPVGVGESTLGHFNKYLRSLGLKDEEWMPKVGATYKNSIQFTDFREKGSTFQYPFGPPDLYNCKNDIQDWFDLQRLYPDEFPPELFAKYYLAGNTCMAEHNKIYGNKDGRIRDFDFASDTAYHIDADRFAEYLRDEVCYPYAEQDRFTHITGDVRGMVKDVMAGGSPAQSNRVIKQLAVKLAADKKTIGVQGDLFIDCTGFKGALIEEMMAVRHISFEKYLPNDKAFFARIPYTSQKQRKEKMHNVTDCRGANNGWMWTIPLWDRIGVGYCWSSRFAMETEARQEFEMWIDEEFDLEPDEYEIQTIDIKHGYREKAWELNCVAIGMSYGFIEPLESTGLLTTHENILRLVDVLNRREGYVSGIERQWFNYAAQREVIGFSHFVAMHYALSKRTDNPYWRHASQRCEYMLEQFDGNIKVNDEYERMGDILDLGRPLRANVAGMNFIAAGMGLKLGTRFNGYGNVDELTHIGNERLDYIKEVEEFIKSDEVLTHYEFLKQKIYGEDNVQLPEE